MTALPRSRVAARAHGRPAAATFRDDLAAGSGSLGATARISGHHRPFGSCAGWPGGRRDGFDGAVQARSFGGEDGKVAGQ